MLRPIDNYYLQQEEPVKSCLQFMRTYILKFDPHITEAWKYGMPFFCYKGKMFCYLWVHKQWHKPYLGLVEGRRMDHPDLLQEKRARMKILLLAPEEDIPLQKIDGILEQAISFIR